MKETSRSRKEHKLQRNSKAFFFIRMLEGSLQESRLEGRFIREQAVETRYDRPPVLDSESLLLQFFSEDQEFSLALMPNVYQLPKGRTLQFFYATSVITALLPSYARYNGLLTESDQKGNC